MHQDRCVELARQAAVDCGERHDYMPATPLLAEVWHPHRWVVDAMLLAADEAERERDSFKAGNTTLLDALMQCVEGGAGAVANTQKVLGEAGMLNGADGSLNWAALQARKPKPITWEQAVNECVTLLRGVRAVMEADRAAPVVDRPATQQAALAKAAIERDSLIAAERASLLRAKWDAEADEIATAGHAGLMDEVDALIARRDARLAADDGQAPASQASTIPLRTDGGNLPDVVMTDGTRRKVRRTTLKKHGFSGYQVDHPNGWSSYMTAAELAAFRRVDANGLPAKPGAPVDGLSERGA